jgi:hypothetical protein
MKPAGAAIHSPSQTTGLQAVATPRAGSATEAATRCPGAEIQRAPDSPINKDLRKKLSRLPRKIRTYGDAPGPCLFRLPFRRMPRTTTTSWGAAVESREESLGFGLPHFGARQTEQKLLTAAHSMPLTSRGGLHEYRPAAGRPGGWVARDATERKPKAVWPGARWADCTDRSESECCKRLERRRLRRRSLNDPAAAIIVKLVFHGRRPACVGIHVSRADSPHQR